jgi:hypothetical protein
MLLIEENQVQVQEVINLEEDHPRPFIGIVYQNKLFKKLKSFPKDRFERAQHYLRELSSNRDTIYLMTQGAEKYIIWCEDARLQAYDASQSDAWISKIDLKNLVREMRDIGGIKIQDRRYRLMVYPRCFVGSEATAWLVHRFQISTAEAVKLGQRLIDAKLMHHVTDDHDFKDGYFFYRFYWDD